MRTRQFASLLRTCVTPGSAGVLVLTSHFGESLIWGLAAGLHSSLIEEPLEASEADGSFSAQLTAGRKLKAQNRRWCLKVAERFFCSAGGQWQGLLPGHAAPRLFEELKARGGSLRDLHLHLHAPGSATVSALVCREACVSKEPLTCVSKILPTAGCQCWILPKRWKGEKKNERRLMCMCVRMLARDGSCSKPRAWVLTPCVKRH